MALFFESFFKFNYENLEKSETSFNLKKRFDLVFKIFDVQNINDFNFMNVKSSQLSAVKKQLKRMKEPKFSTNLYVPTQLKNGKIRLSNIKLEEFKQLMRDTSKWIKHQLGKKVKINS